MNNNPANDLLWAMDNHIGVITLNRPHRKNAFTLAMIDRWAGVLHAAATDDQVRVIILAGAGGTFCSGIDLDDTHPNPTPLEARRELTDRIHRIPRLLDDIDKPVIASIAGHAVGAGLDMALMCDLRIASDDAVLSTGYIHVGLIPGDGGAYYLPRIVGAAKALELLWTGEFISAAAARSHGIVNRVVPAGQLHAETMSLAEQLAAKPPHTIQAIKRAVGYSTRTDLRTALDLAASYAGVNTSPEVAG